MIRDVAVKSIISNIRFFKILVVRKKKKKLSISRDIRIFYNFRDPAILSF